MRAIAKGKYQKWLDPDGRALIEGWGRRGLTNEQIAHNMGISRSTLDVWCKTYPDISDALKSSKEVADINVENALYKRAIGYTYEEVRQEIDDRGKKKIIKTIKQIPPDTTAQIFWLKNRQSDRWRNRPAENENDDDPLLKYLEGMRNA